MDCQWVLHNLCSRRTVWHRWGPDVPWWVVPRRTKGRWPRWLAPTCVATISMGRRAVCLANAIVVRSILACQATADAIRQPIEPNDAIPLRTLRDDFLVIWVFWFFYLFIWAYWQQMTPPQLGWFGCASASVCVCICECLCDN